MSALDQISNNSESAPTVSHSVVQAGLSDGTVDGGGNRTGDPLLGPLADTGGPTLTHLPMVGSSAIDIGGTCGPTDQRGFEAPLDGDGDGAAACDAGAVEAPVPTPPQTFVVTQTGDAGAGGCTEAGTGDGCTLREAVEASNANPSEDAITSPRASRARSRSAAPSSRSPTT